MAKITDAARIEVLNRRPVWRDDDEGASEGNGFRSGFVAGAEWAESHFNLSHEIAKNDRTLARDELTAARAEIALARESLSAEAAESRNRRSFVHESLELEDEVRSTPMSESTRELLLHHVAEVLDTAPIQLSADGQSMLGDPTALARQVLNAILTPGVVGFEASAQVAQLISQHGHTGPSQQFRDELPPASAPRGGQVDWAAVKRQLMTNEGKWGLMVENVSTSTPQQLQAGRNKNFRGEELSHFEFRTRKPTDPQVPYAPLRTDLWGRYTKSATLPQE